MILTKEYLNETPQPCSSYNVTCKPIEFYAANSSDLNSEANKNYAYIIESTENLNETTANPVDNTANVAIIAGAASFAIILLLCLFISCGIFLVHKTKSKRKHHGTYSPSREERTGGRRMELSHVLKPPPVERLI